MIGRKQMPGRLKSLTAALAAAVALAAPVQAQGLKQVATIAIPGAPIAAFGVMFIDQASGLGYFADKDNNAVDIIDTRTDKFAGRIAGFAGTVNGGASSGPNGVLSVNQGAELWVSDGDSTIKVIESRTGQIVGTIATGGKKRANAMAYDPKDQVVIVANPNDEPAFLSLISTAPGRKILAKIPIADAAEGMERSDYLASTGMFYTDVPMLRADHTRGALAQIDPRTGKLVQLHELEHCNPHSIAIVAEKTLFLGCSVAPAGSAAPGGELAVFDVGSGKAEAYLPGLGGSGDTVFNPALGQYYHSASATLGGPALRVIDVKSRKLLQQIPTSNGAHSIGISLAQNRVYLPTTAKDGPCGGCILVFAPQ
jgi:DNA-binding beta-propeller fold protein YncE